MKTIPTYVRGSLINFSLIIYSKITIDKFFFLSHIFQKQNLHFDKSYRLHSSSTPSLFLIFEEPWNNDLSANTSSPRMKCKFIFLTVLYSIALTEVKNRCNFCTCCFWNLNMLDQNLHLNPRWKSNSYQEKDNDLQNNYLTTVPEMFQRGPDWKASEVKGNSFHYSKQNLGKAFVSWRMFIHRVVMNKCK